MSGPPRAEQAAVLAEEVATVSQKNDMNVNKLKRQKVSNSRFDYSARILSRQILFKYPFTLKRCHLQLQPQLCSSEKLRFCPIHKRSYVSSSKLNAVLSSLDVYETYTCTIRRQITSTLFIVIKDGTLVKRLAIRLTYKREGLKILKECEKFRWYPGWKVTFSCINLSSIRCRQRASNRGFQQCQLDSLSPDMFIQILLTGRTFQ